MNQSLKPDLRERVLSYGLSYPSDSELLMLILGSGSREFPVEMLSEKILDTIQTSRPENLVERLLKIPGVGHSKALQVSAALEFGKRQTRHLNSTVHSPKDIFPFLKQYGYKKQEHFVLVVLNGAREILSITVIAIGTSSRASIDTRELFYNALMQQGSSLILCHNHPSGNLEPSEEDIRTTRSIVSGAALLGLSVMDHLIIWRESYFSFFEHQLLSDGVDDTNK